MQHTLLLGLHHGADGAERLGDLIQPVGHTGETLGQLSIELDDLRKSRISHLSHRSGISTTGKFHQKVSDPLCGNGWKQRIHAALEAFGRFGRQPVATLGTANADRIEVRSFHHDGRGAAGDLRAGTAHHPGNTEGAVVVGDHKILRMELTFLII